MTRTDNLIDTLVSDLTPVRPHALRLRLAAIVAIGVVGAAFALIASLGLRSGVHHVTTVAFLVKFSYTAILMSSLVIALDRVARPEGSVVAMIWTAVTTIVITAILGVVQLIISPTESYPGLILGFSALICPFLIFGFSLPAFLANIWFLRRAAPMDAGLAGFVAGACAGATGAWVYSWACTENGIPFIAIWYTVGILLSAVLGLFVGRLSLRW